MSRYLPKYMAIFYALWVSFAILVISDAEPQFGYISVSVATLWTDSSKPRSIDRPALTNPSLIQQWLDSMTDEQYLDLTTDSRTQTQVLYGSRVEILNQTTGWYEIAVPGELTPKNALGYPGWIPATQISFDGGYGTLQLGKPIAAVDKVPRAMIYRDLLMRDEFMEISYDTRLPVIWSVGPVIQIALPSGGSAYLSTRDATVYRSETAIPYPNKDNLVKTAKMFLGRPYLWGGTSGFAFDCSGFTHTVYHGHGVTLGRDANAQASPAIDGGIRVSEADLQAGDLIFYANDLNDVSSIYHVAMYIGDGEMIEAYDSGTPVRIAPVRFSKDYWGALRFLKN